MDTSSNKSKRLSPHARMRKYWKLVKQINELEPSVASKSNGELLAQSQDLKQRAQSGESLNNLLVDAFALVREASRRTLGLRHYDVQLIGAMILNDGCIAEMKTGEGKTLVATAAAYLNALSGKHVHVVTVNDYLAKRDAEEVGQIYNFLGLTVGLLQNSMKPDERRPEYQCDIIYGTNTEFGFDYLKDNMVSSAEERVQTGFSYAIVDEVDSILIDEARTPLIISGSGGASVGMYQKFARMARLLTKDDVVIDEAKQTVYSTEEGLTKAEHILGMKIYNDTSGVLANHLQSALRAQFLFHRDDQYVVVDGKVKIVDEFTGRILEGRRYNEGLHQAIEAKEGVAIKPESHTLATVTLQNYFRLYDKLCGMTGTAMTDDQEFRETYHLPVVEVPTNKPVIRKDQNDYVFRTMNGKWKAVVKEIEERHAKGQPILVGTATVEASEHLSKLLDERGIPHTTLNAKNPEYEAHIVANAGRRGAVTISTNMAGRGTDIKLGGDHQELFHQYLREVGADPRHLQDWQIDQGNKYADYVIHNESYDVLLSGGLYVIGTERAESRRVDNQLRGRSGRQGDPGESRFFLSLEDRLLRLFGDKRVEKMRKVMLDHGIPEDEPVENSMITKIISRAQMKVEQTRFASRKQVLDYDDVLNVQRLAIYAERNRILDGKDLNVLLNDVINDLAQLAVDDACPEHESSEKWDYEALNKRAIYLTGKDILGEDELESRRLYPEHLKSGKAARKEREQLVTALKEGMDQRLLRVKETLGDDFDRVSRTSLLRMIDRHWMNHLADMDYLKEGIGLRGMGQRDPLVEYKEEAYRAFSELITAIDRDWLDGLLRLPVTQEEAEELLKQTLETQDIFKQENLKYSGGDESQISNDSDV